MILMRGTTADDEMILIFGLSHANLGRLLAGNPISVDLNHVGVKGKVMIFSGETEQSMQATIMREGIAAGAEIKVGKPPATTLVPKETLDGEPS